MVEFLSESLILQQVWLVILKVVLGYVAIISGLIFSGLSGSAVADTAALGAILIPDDF